MAEVALATKKRLYTKALDSLTSPQPSLSSDAAASTKRPATAAAAFDEARERASKRLRQSASSSSLRPILVPSPAATPKRKDAEVKDPPNFAPWSHEAFLARLKTFSNVSLWHPKPEPIDEVEWAKRGWVCVDVNTVRCKGGCEKRVVVNLEAAPKAAADDQQEGLEDENEDGNEDTFERALAERYKDVITEGHAETCLWRKAGCKDDIYHLQVVRPSVWQPELRKRFQSALEIGSAIENVTTKPLDGSTLNLLPPKRLLEDMPHNILDDSTSERTASSSSKALEVALHGWRGSKESGTELLHCDHCFQRVGLWMYQPNYRPAQSPSADNDSDDDFVIDLVELHREHCPWRNSTSQKASGSLKGLNASQILQRVVSTYARDQRRRSNEQAGVTTAEPDHEGEQEMPAYDKEEVARQDKERDSRLRRLKSLFNIKRTRTKSAPKALAG